MEIETNFYALVTDEKNIPDGINIEFNQPTDENNFAAEIITIAVSFIAGTASSVLASWIYDKIKKPSKEYMITLIINKTEIRDFTYDEIKNAIDSKEKRNE